MHQQICAMISALLLLLTGVLKAETPSPLPRTTPGDRMISDYFRAETAGIAGRCLADVKTREDWEARKAEYRRQLFEMLGLWPMPARSELHPTITGTIDSDEFTVERLHFQSMPHLYVTANLYLPKGLSQPAPAILYVCGHAKVKENGVSLGNKTWAQYYGEWFARNGYVCLIIDSLELGEIEGVHHGTYNLGMWWWQSRGYTPAGVEAWNGIRALDYLCSRKEVDPNRIGMTGRSGGGAYTWYVAALDERVKVACPTAGITDLQNHVVDGTVEGHCDCMFMDNTYRWDFPQVAALISPRALLICNTDKDTIFPLDGIYRVHEQVRRIYSLQGAEKNLGLLITEGPHQDTQDLQVPVFRWFNRFLKNEQGPIEKVVKVYFKPQELRVFDRLPADQINTKIQETFGPTAPAPAVPASKEEWDRQRDRWLSQLREKTFMAWPESSPPALDVKEAVSQAHDGVRFRAFEFTSQHDIRLRLYILQAEGAPPAQITVDVLNDSGWKGFAARMRVGFEQAFEGESLPAADTAGFADEVQKVRSEHRAMAWVAPRGIGPTAWTTDARRQTQIRRRFALLGQTLDGMRVWDVRRAVQAIRSLNGFEHASVSLSGEDREAGVALYAALFEPGIARLDLTRLPASHRAGPELLNVLQTLDIAAALAMAAERSEVHLRETDPDAWAYPKDVARQLGWPADQLRVDR